MRILFSVLSMMMVISCLVAQVGNGEQLKDKELSRLLSKYAAHDEPGIQYIVVDKSSTVYSHSVGLSNVEKDIVLDASQTMAAFSMTKTLTAIAVLQLVEQNKINLDNKVTEYVTHPYDPNITIQHLLNHTSGIPNPIPLKWVHLAREHDDFDEQFELNKVLNEHSTLDFKPGERYKYNNIGYWLLGRVIKSVSGIEYLEYMSEHLFQPLNLSSNEIGFQIYDKNNHAKGYLKKWSFMGLFGRFFVDPKMLSENETGWVHIKNVYLNGPSFGGAIGTAGAFSKILQDLLSTESMLLEQRTKQLLYQQQMLNSGTEIDMTLGWHMAELDGTNYYYKEGGGAGFHCEMRIYPKKGLASVIMSNRTSFNSRKILSELDIRFVENEI